jgi:hypothetical protein
MKKSSKVNIKNQERTCAGEMNAAFTKKVNPSTALWTTERNKAINVIENFKN